jgi:hypothetical protein
MYTIPGDDGRPSAALETHFARKVEAPFASWRTGITTARPGQAAGVLRSMRLDRARMVARYLAYQHLRTPATRAFLRRLEGLSQLNFLSGRATRAELEAEWRRRDPRARLPMTRAERRLAMQGWRDACHQFLVEWRAQRPHLWLDPIHRFVEATVPYLVHARIWRIAELPRDVARERPFVTCDHPVALVTPRSAPPSPPSAAPGWDVDAGGGWTEFDVQLSLTLSPRHALVLGPDGDALDWVDDPDAAADILRVRTVRHAYDAVFARDSDAGLAALVRSTRKPEVLYEVAGRVFPSTAPNAAVLRHVHASGADKIWVRYAG